MIGWMDLSVFRQVEGAFAQNHITFHPFSAFLPSPAVVASHTPRASITLSNERSVLWVSGTGEEVLDMIEGWRIEWMDD